MRQIALGVVVTGLIATSAFAQETASGRLVTNGALAGVTPVAVTATAATAAAPAFAAADQAPAAPAAPQAPAAPAAPAAAPAGNAFAAFLSNTEIFGTTDFYYAVSGNRPPAGSAIPLRIFDSAQNQFSLAMLELGLSKPVSKDDPVGYKFVLAYGPSADTVNFAEPKGNPALANVEQAYVSYYANVGTGLQLDFGKFVTALGNEVIESKDNWNYSRGILFGYAIPFYHVGARLSYSPNDKVSLGAQVLNGWNNEAENNTGKTFEGSVTYKPNGKTSLIENYIVGQEEAVAAGPYRNVSDTILSYTVNDKVSVAVNGDYGKEGDAKWYGVAAYLRDQITPVWAFAPRYEYYSDPDGFTTLLAQKMQEVTVTFEAKAKAGLITRFEYRHDMSNGEYFVASDGTPKKSQDTFEIGVVLGFSSK